MPRARHTGLAYSAALHLLILVLLVAGLPVLFDLEPPPEPMAITVEILPITGFTNIKPSEAKPTPKEAEEKKPEAKKPTPPTKAAESAPTPPPLEEKKTEKPQEKKPEDKKTEKKEKMKEEDLLAVLKSVKESAQAEQKDKPNKKNTEETSPSKSKSERYDPSLPLSLSEKDAIKNQIMKCWTVPAGAKDAHDLVIVLRAQYNRDGSYISVELAGASKARYGKDTFFRAAADSALRAVRMCSPLKDLPPDKYETWRDIELHFDPREMLY